MPDTLESKGRTVSLDGFERDRMRLRSSLAISADGSARKGVVTQKRRGH